MLALIDLEVVAETAQPADTLLSVSDNAGLLINAGPRGWSVQARVKRANSRRLATIFLT